MGTQSFNLRLRVLMREVLVDQEDLDRLGHERCFVLKSHKHYKYWGIKVDGVKTYLHRVIMNAPKDLVVDHINGNTCDNRKENLRLCSNIDNTKNLRKQVGSCTSQYKGVSFYTRDSNWEVNVACMFFGRYKSEIEAAKVYNEKAILLFGEFARLNIIESSDHDKHE